MTTIQEQASQLSTEEREKIVQLVRKWGGATSDAVLDPLCKIFQTPDAEGFIGYRSITGCAIVYGDPICDPKDRAALTGAFHSFCKEQGWSIIYLATTESFAQWAMEHICNALIEFGVELTIDPSHDPREYTGVKGSLVRRKVRHAQHENVVASEYVGSDPKLEEEITQLGVTWLRSRKGPQIYISHVHLFVDRYGKRWFYAKHNNKVIGVLVLNKLEASNGWLFNHLMVAPDAPGGTPEILVVTALEAIKKEGSRFVTFGSIPAPQLGEIAGFSATSTWLSRWVFMGAQKIFRLSGSKKFWEKFHPERKSSYLLFSESHLSLKQVYGLMRSLNTME